MAYMDPMGSILGATLEPSCNVGNGDCTTVRRREGGRTSLQRSDDHPIGGWIRLHTVGKKHMAAYGSIKYVFHLLILGYSW